MSLLRSIFTVGSLTMVSRVLGLFRDMLLAAFLGAGAFADAFFVAFRFPNFFRALFAEGAFSAAFVPKFSEILTKQGRQNAFLFAEHAIALLGSAVMIFVLLAEALMPMFVHFIAPGFGDDAAQFALAVDLSRITFPYLLLMSMVALYGGVLNALDKFSAFAASPIVMNIVMMITIVAATPFLPNAAYAAALGVLLSGVAQLVWMVYAGLQIDVRLKPKKPVIDADMKAMLKAMLPAVLGSGVLQVNLLIGVMIASTLPDGSVSFLYYADRLFQLPIGVFGIAVGTALLPILSKNISAGNMTAAMENQNRAIEITWLLTLPAAVALMIMPLPIIDVLFVRGEFTKGDAQATAFALGAFALGLPAVVLVRALAPNFFARGDTKTPLNAAMVTVALNTFFNVLLMGIFNHVGIALGTALASWANVALLIQALQKKGHIVFDERLKQRIPRIIAAAVLMGVLVLVLKSFLGDLIHAEFFLWQLLGLLILVAFGVAAYAALAIGLKASSIEDLKHLWHKSPL